MTTPQDVPERSLVQRMEALQRANDVRTYRARMKEQMKGGGRSVIDVLDDAPAEVSTMKVHALLLSQPKVGRVKANKIMAQCRISPSKTIGGLTDRQRSDLAYVVRTGRSPVRQPTGLL